MSYTYLVVKGDNLWKIAARELGGGEQWPRLWKYNNRREVVQVTGRPIPNPDLIYIGQRLLIPKVPKQVSPVTTHQVAAPHLPEAVSPTVASQQRPGAPLSKTPADKTLSDRLPALQSPIAFKFRFPEDMRWPPVDVGVAIVEARMTGDIVLMTKQAYPVTYVTSRGELETQITREMKTAFGKLVSDNRYIFDPISKRVTMRSMLVIQSDTPYAPATAVGLEMSSNSPIPKLRAEIRIPKLTGSLGTFRYSAVDLKFVLEITPKPPPPGINPQPIHVPVTVPVRGTDWSKVIGTGLVVTAGVIVVATIVEDFYTAGVGTGDDAASFSLASASFVRGLSMIRGVVLPAAAAGGGILVTSTVAVTH